METAMRAMLGFDMETDVGSWTPFYNGLAGGTAAILEILRQRQVTATFFFTGHCARRNPEVVRAVQAAGHEIGCHSLYHETVGEALFEIPGAFPLLPTEVPERLRLATAEVEAVAGERPVSFRCPRLFGSTAVVNALEDLGYLADASYPLYYYRARLEPYHPAREDWTQTGGLRLVELPNFADLSQTSHDPYGRDLDQWPRLRTESAEALLVNIRGFAGYARARQIEPFLGFYFHPWEFSPMPQGEIAYGEGRVRPDPFIVKNCGEYAAGQLQILIEKLQAEGTEFLTARAVAEATPA